MSGKRKPKQWIRNGSLTLLTAVGLFALVLGINTARFTPHTATPPPAIPETVNATAVAKRLSAAVRCRTISPSEPLKQEASAFTELHALLRRNYPLVHARMKREVLGRSLLYTWPGSNAALPPALIMAHEDVVPVEPGTESQWTHPPFAGQIVSDHVWGRGTMDDKLSLVGCLEAAELLLRNGYRPERTFYFAFGHDEESGGHEGNERIAALLKSRGVRLGYVLDEGGAIVEGAAMGIDRPVALVGIAEKGSLTLELSAFAPGGHSSMPPPETTVGIVSAAVRNLEKTGMPARLDGATLRFVRAVGPWMPLPRRIAVANTWLFAPVIASQLAAEPSTNAMVRTTTAPTLIEGGTKENILPPRARALVNFRLLPGDTILSVTAHAKRVIADGRVEVKALPNTAFDPSTISSTTSEAFQSVVAAVRAAQPDAVVAPGLTVGATDSRHYAPLAEAIYRTRLFRATTTDLRRIHGTNERVSLEDCERTVKFYLALFRAGS